MVFINAKNKFFEKAEFVAKMHFLNIGIYSKEKNQYPRSRLM